MAISNAEKQRRYRQNRFKRGELGEYRINTFVGGDCYFALERLARHYNINKKEVIEMLITAADKTISHNLGDNPDLWDIYFNINESK
ncbi:hypothetical protein EVH55_26755 [Salmonella enterica subsp. enterica serovar Benin]|nr:hypothetical protein [Salmonella enterica subsp. enterica serovar Benin]EHB9444853.1 hypothetical protein [Salmonella enterica]